VGESGGGTNGFGFAGRADRVSNGFSGELKFGIFQEVIEEDEEFTHDGHESDFLGLTRSHEPIVERFLMKCLRDRNLRKGRAGAKGRRACACSHS
jgi:hypothetical protein